MLRLKDRINLNEDIAMPQEIQEIDVNDLVLWTENPRHPIKATATDQDIADRAISKDGRSRWSIEKLFKSMGDWYDTSEIPTVVYVDGKPVVYDGNRRVLIGKIIHKCVKGFDLPEFDSPEFDFPKKIPCNVCDNATALKNIERKHAKGGSWKALERDIFKHYHMGEDKSAFLVIDEITGIISNNPFMNQDFVKKEIFSFQHLKDLNILIHKGVLTTPYTPEAFEEILWQIVDLVRDKEVTTRKNRYELISLLNKDTRIKSIVSKNKRNTYKPFIELKLNDQNRRTKKEKIPLFGNILPLKIGMILNLLLDLQAIHNEVDQDKYSEHATMIVAMGLRLICESAAAELTEEQLAKKTARKKEITLKDYVEDNFDDAKQKVPKKYYNYLRNNSVEKKSMVGLLNTGAHGYADTLDEKQTIALSLIIGKILEKTHGAETSK